MFWKKASKEAPSAPKAEKLPGPKSIDELVGRHLVTDKNQNPNKVWNLMSVVRHHDGNSKHTYDFRVFDGTQASVKKVKIKDYNSLDSCPELIMFQGWFDKDDMKVTFDDGK